MTHRTSQSVFYRKPAFLICVLLSCALATYSQQVTCSHTLDSVKAYIEKNYAGFADKVNAQTQQAYEAHTMLSYQYAERAKSAADYYSAIHHWLTFFKDHHLYIKPPAGLGDEGWYKNGAAIKKEPVITPCFEEENRMNTFFKTLNDSTCYLRIKSFDASYTRDIDSVIRTNIQSILSTSRFIIDLRGNGGGSDRSTTFLKPILYTDPVKTIGVDLLTTPDNTAAWNLLVSKYRNVLPKDQLDNLSKKLHQFDGLPAGIVNFTSDRIDTLQTAWTNPAKIAIVIDGKCGSTTEEFLLFALQSKKVKMVGEHSLGVLDYSNVVPREFSCPPFTLHYPTTRSRRIDVGLGIDNKGIQVDIPLNLSNDTWPEELERKW